MQSFIVQCSADVFDHAAWLSAVHSEIISIDEEEHRLNIYPMSEMLRGQFEKLGAVVKTTG